MKINPRYPTKCVFMTRNVGKTHYSVESLANLSPKIWNIIPKDIKTLPSVNLFKTKIKKWDPSDCPCKLCKIYIPGLGYIN